MKLTHFNKHGKAHMVDISAKNDRERTAIARGCIKMQKQTLDLIKHGDIKKGDALSCAQVAGIMSAKKTADLIPMAHNISLSHVDIKFNLLDDKIEIESYVKTIGKTGAEMEALTAVSIAALTIYDMCKSVDKEMIIGDIKLIEKKGGKSGLWKIKE